MSNPRDDELIRERFRALRADVERSESRLPKFRAMMDRAGDEVRTRPALTLEPGGARAGTTGGRRRLLWAGGWASALAAAALAGLLLTSGGEDQDAEFDRLVSSYVSDASSGAWRSPTSRLLEIPGIELMRSVPSVGGALSGLDAEAPPAPPSPQGREERL